MADYTSNDAYKWDQAHIWTDREIDKLQARFEAVYTQAAREMAEKLKNATAEYDKANEEWKARVRAGDATAKQYDAWREREAMNLAFTSGLADSLAETATQANRVARDYINDAIPVVYAENANYAAYEVESALGWDTHSFDLYDVDAIRRLVGADRHYITIHEVISMGPAIPNYQNLRVDVDAVKDVRWNRQKFTSALTQSMLQGESVPNAANRLMQVLNMDRTMATRAARTAMTSAQNAGRLDSYRRARAIGIEMEQQWMAAVDMRTRQSHRELDGQHVPVGELFKVKSNGHTLRFPGDPAAHPSESYNCRCTLVAWFPDIEQEDPDRWTELPEGMTYDEWQAGKKVKAGKG